MENGGAEGGTAATAGSSERVNLSWNNYETEIRTSLVYILGGGVDFDVKLFCEDQYLMCHSFILQACSGYFNRLFDSSNKIKIRNSKDPVLVVIAASINFEELRDLLIFMYTGQITVPKSRIPALLKAAEVLQIKGIWKGDDADGETISENPTYYQNQGLLSTLPYNPCLYFPFGPPASGPINSNDVIATTINFLLELAAIYPNNTAFQPYPQLQHQHPPFSGFSFTKSPFLFPPETPNF